MTHPPAWPFRAFRLGIVVLLLLLSGCADLAPVRDFAALSCDSAAYGAIARDYAAAPAQRKRYAPQRFHAELDAMAARREAQMDDLLGLQQALALYMRTLGTLADDGTVAFERPADGFAAGLGASGLIDARQKAAASRLVDLVASAGFDVYRRREIGRLVADADAPLQEVIAALRAIVGRGMAGDLQVESESVRRYYDHFMLRPDNPPEPVAMVIAAEAKDAALQRVELRIARVRDYDRVLEAIAAGHRGLLEQKDRLGAKAAARQLKPHVDRLREAYQALRGAQT